MPARFDPAAYTEVAHVTVDLLAEHVAASQRGEGAATVRLPMADIARDLDLPRLLRERAGMVQMHATVEVGL